MFFFYYVIFYPFFVIAGS